MNVFDEIKKRLQLKKVPTCFTPMAEYVTYPSVVEIVNQVEREYNAGWIPCSRRLPECSDDNVLVQCSGKPRDNVILEDAICLAAYTEEGWILEEYPEWEGAVVIAWQPLPEPYKEI